MAQLISPDLLPWVWFYLFDTFFICLSHLFYLCLSRNYIQEDAPMIDDIQSSEDIIIKPTVGWNAKYPGNIGKLNFKNFNFF